MPEWDRGKCIRMAEEVLDVTWFISIISRLKTPVTPTELKSISGVNSALHGLLIGKVTLNSSNRTSSIQPFKPQVTVLQP